MDFKLTLISFEDEINKIKSLENNPKKQAISIVEFCDTQLATLKKQVITHGFKSNEEEIYFFKHIKPIILSEQIFYQKMIRYILDCPVINIDSQKYFILKLNRNKDKFIKKHQDLSIYLDSGNTTSDEVFFLRKKKGFAMMFTIKSKFMDPRFNTAKDLILAKLLGYKKFKNHLQIEYDKVSDLNNPRTHENNNPSIQWTASKTALVELIYALHTSRVFNNGKSDIKQIATLLESTFNTELGDIYKTFSEMKYRQKSPTKFLDEMITNLKEEINKSFR